MAFWVAVHNPAGHTDPQALSVSLTVGCFWGCLRLSRLADAVQKNPGPEIAAFFLQGFVKVGT